MINWKNLVRWNIVVEALHLPKENHSCLDDQFRRDLVGHEGVRPCHRRCRLHQGRNPWRDHCTVGQLQWNVILLKGRNPASNSELAIFMEQTLTVKCREKINLSKKRPEITHNWPGWDNNKTINKAKVSPARRSGTSESCPSSSSSVTATRISSSGSLEDLRCTEMVKTFRIETGKRSRLVRPSLDQLIHFVHGYDQLNKDIKALTCMFLLGIS